jgi:uncharacterized membrane protein YeaQ/YmgE (transglycosylase-associated protein family)
MSAWGVFPYLDPVGVIAWLVVGLSVGALAGRFVEGGRSDMGDDIVLGINGACLAGLVFHSPLFGRGDNLLSSIAVAFLGAEVFVGLERAWMARRNSQRT